MLDIKNVLPVMGLTITDISLFSNLILKEGLIFPPSIIIILDECGWATIFLILEIFHRTSIWDGEPSSFKL